MRILRYTVLALIFLIVFVAIGGLFLPSKVSMSRSVFIEKPTEIIFKFVNSQKNFNDWSPWFGLDPNAVYTISGAESGVGSKISWQGNDKVYKGSNEIIESEENKLVRYEFYFGKSDQPAFSNMSFKPVGNGTTVAWTFENDFGYNVFYRYFGLILEDMIAPDYEKGLSNLKVRLEKQ